MDKRSSAPDTLSRCQTSDTRPSASFGYCCPRYPSDGRFPGIIRLIEPQGGNGHRRPVLSASSSGTSRESQTNVRDGTVWRL